MIFIFATAVCGYAQEAPAAEQNDDSELILRYQNRRTMRGYKMLFEAGYQWGLPDKEGFLCGVYDPDKWSVYNPQNETFRHSRTSRLFS